MNKILYSKFWWLFVLIVLAGINYVGSVAHFRLDLTKEKRYTLSHVTKKLLGKLDDRVQITVFLDGDMPAGFKKLRNSTEELLQDFKEYGKSDIQYKFIKPATEGGDSSNTITADSLLRLGLRPTNVRVTGKEGEGEEQRFLFPGAIVSYKDRIFPIDLLQGQDMTGGLNSLNNAEALLEFKFAHAIKKVTTDTVPLVGYLLGNGESLSYNVKDLIDGTLRPNYRFTFLPIDSVPLIPPFFDALVVMKPTIPFTDKQKLKLDQFVMRGGKIIWLIDRLYAEMDSLMRTQSDFVAFDRNLNLDDQLFKYGVRINPDLVQDLQCDKIPLVVGNMGDKPQMQLVPWYYFPLLSSYSDHPISKNMDNILSIFPNSIDTVKSNGIRKTILLSTSENARSLSTPAIVSLNSVKTESDRRSFNKSHIPIAVLLEGKFTSLYTNRLSQGILDTLAGVYNQPFRAAPEFENKMIVISDADIAGNVVSQKEGPLPMGYNQFTQYQYANKDFLLNCLEYLLSNDGILETRAKDFTLRLLDVKKTESGRAKWQIISIGLPIVLVLLFGFIYQALRKRKYQ